MRPNDQKPCESETENARGLAQKPITPSLSKCNHIPSSEIPNSAAADTQVLRTSLASRVATALMPSMPSLSSPHSQVRFRDDVGDNCEGLRVPLAMCFSSGWSGCKM